jgi:hypothetical protein
VNGFKGVDISSLNDRAITSFADRVFIRDRKLADTKNIDASYLESYVVISVFTVEQNVARVSA